jgi:hypothetical protein
LFERDGTMFVDTIDAVWPHPVSGIVSGSDIVAGEKCDIWRVKDADSQLTQEWCITADGIWLRLKEEASGSGGQVVWFDCVEQDPALFPDPKQYAFRSWLDWSSD